MGLWDRDYMRERPRRGEGGERPRRITLLNPRFFRTYPVTTGLLIAQSLIYLMWLLARWEAHVDPANWFAMHDHFVPTVDAIVRGRVHTLFSHTVSSWLFGDFLVRFVATYFFGSLLESRYSWRKTLLLVVVIAVVTGAGAVLQDVAATTETGRMEPVRFPGVALGFLLVSLMIARSGRIPVAPVRVSIAAVVYLVIDLLLVGSRTPISIGAYAGCVAAALVFGALDRSFDRRRRVDSDRDSVDRFLDSVR